MSCSYCPKKDDVVAAYEMLLYNARHATMELSMKVKAGVTEIAHNGKRYTVTDGVIEATVEEIEALQAWRPSLFVDDNVGDSTIKTGVNGDAVEELSTDDSV